MIRLTFAALALIFLTFAAAPAQTLLRPGDLAVLGLASDVGGDAGNCTPAGSGQFEGRDRVSFVCFRDIETGTAIDVTDNGWERAQPGLWGNTEGFLRVVRTGGLIPAGTVITFEFPPTETGYAAIAPDADWDFQVLGINALNFNDTGDQLYFMQGGTWNNGTTSGCCFGDQDGRYTGGTILFAFNSRSGWNGGIDDSQSSALHPDVIPCFHMAPTSGVTAFTSYSGPTGQATQLEWISRIANPLNWTAYADCQAYRDPPANIPIGPGGMAVDCRICRSCGPLTDTLVFSLPVIGGPFTVDYTNGRDTFSVAGAQNGQTAAVTVEETTLFTLTRVVDSNGCPVYSNFESGADILVEDLPLAIACTAVGAAPDGSLEIGAPYAVPPYNITLTGPAGFSARVDGVTSPNYIFEAGALTQAGAYEVIVEDASGCQGQCSFTLEAQACTMTVMLEGVHPDCSDAASGAVTALVAQAREPLIFQWNTPGLSGPALTGLPAGQYRLTVTDQSGCVDSASVILQAPDTMSVDLEIASGPGCQSSGRLRINGIEGGRRPYAFAVNTTAGFTAISQFPLVISDLPAGRQRLIFEDGNGCRQEVPVEIPAPGAALELELGPDQTVGQGQAVYIVGAVNFLPATVVWEPSGGVADPDALVTTVSPDTTTRYVVTAFDGRGCAATDSVLVTVLRRTRVFQPNAFSPNQDGVNDRFALYGGPEVMQIHSLMIFDRWGGVVFDGRGGAAATAGGWDGLLPDGRPAAAGVYLYVATVALLEGGEEVIRGTVTLVR